MKRCEDCGGRAAEHPSGKDCYTDEQERKRDEARERLRDELSEEGRKTQNTERPQWFKDLLAQIPRRTLAGQVIPPSDEPDRRGPPALSSPVEDDTARLAREPREAEDDRTGQILAAAFRRAIAEAVAAEREACAQVCDSLSWSPRGNDYGNIGNGFDEAAEAIRARGPAPAQQTEEGER